MQRILQRYHSYSDMDDIRDITLNRINCKINEFQTFSYSKLFFLFHCRDTYYIESFHNAILIYAPKRNQFGDVYNMRVNLACLDWVSKIRSTARVQNIQ